LVDDNVELYYNQKTLKNINKLVKSIKKSDKGLSILYGQRGTGKTNTISYMW
jgi:Tfp pilus assembly pilus retraction ATPase PilT